jgi:beta-ketoacyl synthase-like protein
VSGVAAAGAAVLPAPRIRAVGLCSGWGRGAAAIPADAAAAAGGREVIGLGPAEAARAGISAERTRRATRECLWALASVQAMLEDETIGREAIAGDGTALVFVTAAGYGASNRAFIEGSGGGTHFAYTAPAVVSAEVAIEFGLTGPSALFIGGPPATLHGIWHAASLLADEVCERALVLVVETFAECAELYGRARRLTGAPLVEAAGCLWLEPGSGSLSLELGRARGRRRAAIARRLGETLACEPLCAIARWRADGGREPLVLDGRWRAEAARLAWHDRCAVAAEPAG